MPELPSELLYFIAFLTIIGSSTYWFDHKDAQKTEAKVQALQPTYAAKIAEFAKNFPNHQLKPDYMKEACRKLPTKTIALDAMPIYENARGFECSETRSRIELISTKNDLVMSLRNYKQDIQTDEDREALKTARQLLNQSVDSALLSVIDYIAFARACAKQYAPPITA